uniref:ribosomal protein S1 n=1 Tax=Tsunamia transpacifica TaxID=1935457 RepID=UPI001BEE0A5B|nr:ribosomal protein S1 [Tsunamia transpacifica]QUE27984.1 ribosomal protein S1 [Tsunamia transpacifica]UNJ14499.1 ribosomal protein S1 [Tsunamia transpacifica]
MSLYNEKLNYHFTYKNFAALLNKYEYHFHPGDIVAGTILNIETSCVLVDIGATTIGFLPVEEISSNRIQDVSKYLKLNEVREFFILFFDPQSRQILISMKKVELIRAWKRIQQLYAENAILQTQVIRSNRGGYIVQLEGIKGFIPNSHLILMNKDTNLVNTVIAAKILELDESQSYLLLSLRCAYIQKNRHLFTLGKIVTGIIYSIQPYGLFINVEQLQGLLHASEIIKRPEESLKEMFTLGQELSVMIIHVDNQKGRITFSQRGIMSN